jgi:HAE1 family hydrophobic/amphiphilic exporter-1
MSLSKFAVNKKITVLMVSILVIILGSVAFFSLGLDMMPDIDYPMISIITTYRGASSSDIEETITKPIEMVISSVKNVKKITSQSAENQSIVSVEFEWGTNIDASSQDIRDAVEQIIGFLPAGANRPTVMKFNVSDMPILMYGVTGLEDIIQLEKILEDDVATRLKQLKGVASVMSMSSEEREIQVVVDKMKLDQYNLSIDQISNIIRGQNQNIPGGSIDQRQNEFLIRTIGEYETLAEIENTPVTMTKTGKTIFIKDVAELKDGIMESKSHIRTNSKPTAMMMITKESGANTLTVTDAVKKELTAIKSELGLNIEFSQILDLGRPIRLVTSGAVSNLIVGGLLAICIMFLFLRNWRPTLAISLAIPISLIATFIPLYLAKYTLNLMTLGGLALGVGMLVDNAVVVIENIYRNMELGKNRIAAAEIGTTEVTMAITASTLTTVAVFFPMVFSKGIAGILVRGLALTVSFSLFASLFVALTIVPTFASVFFHKKSMQKTNGKSGFLRGFEKLKNKYLSLLNLSLRHRVITLIIVGIIFLASLSLIPVIGTEFMPKTESPSVILKIKTPVGTSLEETNMIAKYLEESFSEIEDIAKIMVLVGASEGRGGSSDVSPEGSNEAVVFLRLSDDDERKLPYDEILRSIREKLPDLQNVEFNFIDMASSMMGGSSTPIEIEIFGDDQNELKSIAANIENRISLIDEIQDVNNSVKEGKPEIHLKIDKEKSFQYGLTTGQIGSAIETATIGSVVGVFREKGEEIDIRVRLKEEQRNSLDDIKRLSIASPLGFSLPLNQIANEKLAEGHQQIIRERQTRKATITADIEGKDLGKKVAEVKGEISDIISNLPSGYYIEFGGTYKDMNESFRDLIYALILAIILVYAIMASQFESLTQPFVVMFTLPLAFIGVILMFLITNTTLSVASFVGIIMLAGIVVNNGIVLIDHTNQLRKSGIEKHKALIQAGGDRMRPVFITSLTTIAGMLPMAISQSRGSELKSPMALTVIGGLITATFFTLVIIPVIYSIVDHISYKTGKKMGGKIIEKIDE